MSSGSLYHNNNTASPSFWRVNTRDMSIKLAQCCILFPAIFTLVIPPAPCIAGSPDISLKLTVRTTGGDEARGDEAMGIMLVDVIVDDMAVDTPRCRCRIPSGG